MPRDLALKKWATQRAGAVSGGGAPHDPRATPSRVPKTAVVYLHVLPDNGRQTQYECRDCPMFIEDIERCTIHQPDEVIRAHGSCGYFVPGEPATSENAQAHGNLTMVDTGYEENDAGVGFSCKRCAYFRPQFDTDGSLSEQGDCDIVDPHSQGDDGGNIHPNACCAGWKPDETRSEMESDDFARHQAIRQA